MTYEIQDNVEDLEICAKASRAPGQADAYRVRIDDKHFVVYDSIMTGRQLLNTAGLKPLEEHLIYLITWAGILEDIGLEETVDLRKREIERFLTFKSDRSFRFELDSQRQDWGASLISEPTLKQLAGAPDDYRVWQEMRGEEDILLETDAIVDLSQGGVERFYTGSDVTTAGLEREKLPRADQRYIKDHKLAIELVKEGSQSAAIVRELSLPPQTFDATAVDVLILLPPGYPDTSPDMFYTWPWLKLLGTELLPHCADHAFPFGDRNWQRWSRHSQEWRAGSDGIWTVLRRVDSALRTAHS